MQLTLRCSRRLRIQAHHLEPITQVKSPRQVLQFFDDCATGSYWWLAGLVWVYMLMGVLRIPGQMLMHILAGFALGFTYGFPVALLANTASSCALYYWYYLSNCSSSSSAGF